MVGRTGCHQRATSLQAASSEYATALALQEEALRAQRVRATPPCRSPAGERCRGTGAARTGTALRTCHRATAAAVGRTLVRPRAPLPWSTAVHVHVAGMPGCRKVDAQAGLRMMSSADADMLTDPTSGCTDYTRAVSGVRAPAEAVPHTRRKSVDNKVSRLLQVGAKQLLVLTVPVEERVTDQGWGCAAAVMLTGELGCWRSASTARRYLLETTTQGVPGSHHCPCSLCVRAT